MLKLMSEDAKKAEQSAFADAIADLDEVPRTFFQSQFFSPNFRPTRDAVQSRLLAVLENTTFDRMFSAPRMSFDAAQCIADRKIVLINTDRALLGDDGSAILGRFFIAQCLAAALSRASLPPEERHLALLVVDEAKDYFDAKTEKILSDARQFGLGLLFATQFVEQLPDGVRRAMYNNTRIKMAGPIETETRSLATAMRTTPDFLLSMQARDHQYAEFAVHVRGVTSSALKLTVPYGTVEALIEGVPPPIPSPVPEAAPQQMSDVPRRDADLPSPSPDPTITWNDPE